MNNNDTSGGKYTHGGGNYTYHHNYTRPVVVKVVKPVVVKPTPVVKVVKTTPVVKVVKESKKVRGMEKRE